MSESSANSSPEIVGFDVFTAVTMKNAVLLDVAPNGFIINRRFGGTCRFHLQVKKITRVRKSVRWHRFQSPGKKRRGLKS
jgi:hypothetical protein